MSTAVQAPPSPYKGLTHYTEDDTGFFFGRESERGVIIANLMASRLTLVYGASGVGKSSLMRAGVARQLRDLTQEDLREFGEAQFMPVVFTAWKDDPIGELLNCTSVAAQSLFGRVPDVPEGRLDEQLAAISEGLDTTLIIILDQFEEYFLYHPRDEGHGTFAGDFPRALNRRDLRVNFAISIREDALALLDRFKGRVPNLFENYLRIDHLKREAARDAIVKPIDEFNRLHPDEPPVEIEPELVDAVLDQIRTGAVTLGHSGEGTVAGGRAAGNGGAPADDRVETPYLQLVMNRLWNEELGSGSRCLRLETLEGLGGAQRIVRTHLDEAMAALEPGEQEAAATIFRQLVTPSGTKIAHTVPDLADYARLEPAELTPVLEHLSGGDVRILRPVAPPPGQLDGGRYEIFHDVLAPAILDWRARYVEKRARERAERELEESREQARRERRRAAVFGAVALAAIAAAILATILGILTWRQKQTARSRALAEQAVAELSTDPAKSVRDALHALDVKRTQDAKDALVRAVSEARVRRIVHVGGGVVNGVATSPGGRYVATADEDGSVKVWNRNGESAMQLLGHTGPVHAVAFSGNGKFLASAADDATVRIWNLATQSSVVLRHDKKVTDLAYASNRHLLTVSSGLVHEWDTRTHDELWSKRDGKNPVEHVAASNAGGVFATGDSTGAVTIWDAETGKPLGPPSTAHQSPLNSIAFSPDGGIVASTSSDGTVVVWPYETANIYLLLASGGVPVAAQFTPDGQFIAVGYSDDTVRVFDWRSQKAVLELRGHSGGINGLAFTRGSGRLVSASDDRTVRIWNANFGETTRVGGAVDSIATADRGSRFAAAGYAFVDVGDAAHPGTVKHFDSGNRNVPSIEFVPASHGQKVAFASGDAVRVWTVGARDARVLVREPDADVNALAFSADGKRLATGHSDGLARIWKVGTNDAPIVLTGHQGDVNAVAFSPDGKVVATGGEDQTVRLWDARRERKPLAIFQSSGEVTALAFSRHGHLLAAASAGLATKIWNYRKRERTVTARTSSVDAVAFSRDGRYLATVGADALTHIWDTQNGHEVAVLREHSDEITGVAFQQGGTIVSGAADGTTKVYECTTCAPLDDVVRRARTLVRDLND